MSCYGLFLIPMAISLFALFAADKAAQGLGKRLWTLWT